MNNIFLCTAHTMVWFYHAETHDKIVTHFNLDSFMKNLLNAFILFSLLSFSLLQAGSPSPEEQAEAVKALCAQATGSHAVLDDHGNVIKLAISNHGILWKNKTEPLPTPLHPDEFRKWIGTLPHLQAIALEKQHLGDEEYALLGNLKKLTDVRLHYMNEGDLAATADAPLFINDLPLPLTVLEIKHNFKVSGGCMAELKPQPELWKIELDTGYATNDAVPFIMAARKNLRNLQLHRTTITDDQFRKLMPELKELEILEVRPNGPRENPITLTSLSALEGLENLTTLRMSQKWGTDIVYEGGLDALARMPNLKFLSIRPHRAQNWGPDHPAIQKLHQARPDLLIQTGGGGGIGGDGSEKRVPNIDQESNWDGGVTTHG